MNTSMTAPPRRGSLRGFTLIELMLSLTILGILLAVAVPSFREYQANQAVRSAASQLVNAMNFARSEAVKRNTEVKVSAKGTWVTGWRVTAGSVVLMDFAGPGGVQIEAAVDSLTYNGTGRPGGSAAFTVGPVAAEVAARCVRVSGSGAPNNRTGVCP